jgi:peptide/nickel transport system substrate-binding protein
VARISSRRGHVIDERDVCNGPLGMAAGLGSVWVACPLDGTLVRINPRSARILRRVPVGQSPTDVAIAAGQVWVTLESTGTVARYEPDTRTVTSIPVGSGPSAIVASGGSVWVANTLDHTVTRLDAASGRVDSVTPVGSAPESLAAVPDGVWVAEPNARRLALLGGTPSTVRRLVPTPGAVTAVSSRGNSVLAAVSPRAGQHRGGTVRYAAGRDIVTRPDPAVSYSGDAWQILGITNDGLLTYRRTGGPSGETVVPDLAEALPRPADNGREWIFELRRGVRYSTGRAVRAVDFRFALERDFEAGSPAAPLYADIRGSEECRPRKPCDLGRGILIDGRTLTFRLTRPDADFPLKLAMPFADAVPVGWPAPPVNPRDAGGVVPATGPYRISGYTANRSVVLTRNPRYREWSVDAQPPGLPNKIVIEIDAFPRVTGRRIADRTADIAAVYTVHELHVLRARFPDQLVTSALPSTSWEAVNTRRPPFDNVLVRRALAYAVDRAAAARDYAGAKPSCQILPPSFPGYTPFCPYTIAPGPRWQHPDIRHARRLIREAHAKGAVVELVATRGFVNDIATLRRALTRIGLRPRVITMSLARLVPRVVRSPGQFALTSYGWTADYPAPSDFFDELFTCRSFIPHSDGNRNVSEFCSPPIDRMIRRADRLQLADPARADRLWAAVDRAVTRQAPVIPLSSSGITNWVSPRVSGFAYNPFIGVLLDQLWVRR